MASTLHSPLLADGIKQDIFATIGIALVRERNWGNEGNKWTDGNDMPKIVLDTRAHMDEETEVFGRRG
jgi:hypothetical protein